MNDEDLKLDEGLQFYMTTKEKDEADFNIDKIVDAVIKALPKAEEANF